MAWSRLDKIETNIVNMPGYSCIVSTMYLIDFLLVIQTNGTHKFPLPPQQSTMRSDSSDSCARKCVVHYIVVSCIPLSIHGFVEKRKKFSITDFIYDRLLVPFYATIR